MDGYYVYGIKSLVDGRIYIGISRDPEHRLVQHNKGDTKSTKGYRPWVLVYKEYIGDRKLARIREKQLKNSRIKNKLVPR